MIVRRGQRGWREPEETRERMRLSALARWRRPRERERVRLSNQRTCGDPLHRAVKRRLADEQTRPSGGRFGPRSAPLARSIAPNHYVPVWDQ